MTPWTVACQAPMFMEFSRQEYWSGLPFPTTGYLPDPGIKPTYLGFPVLAGRFFTSELPWKPQVFPLKKLKLLFDLIFIEKILKIIMSYIEIFMFFLAYFLYSVLSSHSPPNTLKKKSKFF